MKTIYFNPRAAYECPATRVINIELRGNMMQLNSITGTGSSSGIMQLGETDTDADNAVWN